MYHSAYNTTTPPLILSSSKGDHSIHIYEYNSGECIHTLPAHTAEVCTILPLPSPTACTKKYNDMVVISSSKDSQFRSDLYTIQTNLHIITTPHNTKVNVIDVYSKNDTTIIVSGSNNGIVQTYSINRDKTQ